MWVKLLWLPSLIWLLPAFLLFRLFDIWKPWPVCAADEKLAGGFGIMLDDVLAGLYALAALQLLNYGFQQTVI
jgi:phosphatidylglycerophosphatase A